jgi:aminoglycoside phosphotransferase (APT) family kinase protein
MASLDRQAAFSGTKEVSAPLRLDEARLHAWLADKVPGFAGPLEVRQFRGGQSNPTYLITAAGRQHVLRRKPPGRLLPSAHAVEREFRVTGALHGQGFPVARPIVACEDPDVIGTAFYVMEYVPGRVLWEPQMPHASRAERTAIYDALNATVARLHGYDPAAIGLDGFGRGENYVARQIERWSQQYRASETERIEEMERLIAWLPQHVPPAPPPRLVHGDYRLDNVILAHGRPEVVAVIDWELATLGDPLADFTYHLMAWFMPPSESGAGVGSLVGHDLAALGIPAAEAYVDRYAARTGLDPRPHLPAYLAYNFFRIAAIYQGIVGRVRDGTATSEFAPAKALMVRPLAATAWAFAREAGA